MSSIFVERGDIVTDGGLERHGSRDGDVWLDKLHIMLLWRVFLTDLLVSPNILPQISIFPDFLLTIFTFALSECLDQDTVIRIEKMIKN